MREMIKKVGVRGDESKMFCARLKDTIRYREQWINKHGVAALIQAERISRNKYEEYQK